MEKIAVYGKGGIGKSVVATNLSAFYGRAGKRVLHVGCDPKHDSAVRLLEKRQPVRTILEVLGSRPDAERTKEIINIGRHGIHACEAGGPPAGLGCGGRGVARTIEYLDEWGFLSSGDYDIALFDVLGDVVCGGFAAPLRDGFAEKVVIVVSEEPMAMFAANNISRAVDHYKRNGVVLAGLVVNLRGSNVNLGPLERFAKRLNTRILTVIERDKRIMEAERAQLTLVETEPEANAAKALVHLAETLLALDRTTVPPPTPMSDDEFFELARKWEEP